MFTSLKQQIFTGWHFMRWLRLGIGVYIAVQAVMMNDTMLGFLSTVFLIQAVTNTGCCGTATCAPNIKQYSKSNTTEIEFEEIKKQ